MKEKVKMYICRSEEEAVKLFKKFQEMKLDDLDEENFFMMYNLARENAGFIVKNNTWQLIPSSKEEYSKYFDVEKMFIA